MRGLLTRDKVDTSALEAASVQAVAYADLFDYPLTAEEVHRYLVGVRVPAGAVRAALSPGRLVPGLLECHDGFYVLAGRREIVETRRRRAAVAARIWPTALGYGSAIGCLPFVRMVAVTGALAMDNAESDTDIDYFVVTEPGRLWLCRAVVVALVRLAARRGDLVCPNYFLSERALALQERSVFTAHELVQMVPLAGMATYGRMLSANVWAARFLPNAFNLPRRVDPPLPGVRSPGPNGRSGTWRSPRALAEAALETPLGGWLERWEMNRKVRRFSSQARQCEGRHAGPGGGGGAETSFCADWCKGHFDSHRRRTLEAFASRLEALAVPFPNVAESGEGIEGVATGGPV